MVYFLSFFFFLEFFQKKILRNEKFSEFNISLIESNKVNEKIWIKNY